MSRVVPFWLVTIALERPIKRLNKEDFPRKVHVLGLENPFPEIAVYEFYPENGKAEVSFRCRMRASSYLMIIAEMSDGRLGLKKKYVDVMLGACS